MAALVKEGIAAGALGFSTSRTIVHRAVDGEPVPGTFAAEDEIFGIGQALKSLGAGVFELAPAGAMGEDLAAPEREVALMRRLSAAIGRPISFALLQVDAAPDQWRDILRLAAEANDEGADLRPQVAGRALTSSWASRPSTRSRSARPIWPSPICRSPNGSSICARTRYGAPSSARASPTIR